MFFCEKNDRKVRVMRIGLLTFHRAHNYGALLQCFALQQVLKSMGHDVFVIDYRQPYIERKYKLKIKRVIKRLLFFPKLKEYLCSKYKYTSFFRNFNLTKKCDAKHIPEFDIYVVGSDQLWSLDCTNGIDPVYTGNFYHKSGARLIGYSISVNQESLKKLSDETIKEIIERFWVISFREKSVAQELSRRIGRTFDQTIDPTLLADGSLWEPLIDGAAKKRKYILLYEVRKPSNNKDALLEKTKDLAQKKHVDVIDLSQNNYTVSDFVTAFYYAECVVTSSFHASVFAIIFQKPLCAFLLQDGNDGRYKDLLESVGAKSFIYRLEDSIVDYPIGDYLLIQSRLDQIRKDSVDYLKKAFL